MRALIVENDSAVRLLLCTIFRMDGFEVTEAVDGAQALVELTTQYDVIVVDLFMPVLSGQELLERLAASGHPRNVIVLTAASTHSLLPINRRCVHAVIRKPFDLAQLRETVAAIGRKRVLLVEDDEPTRYIVSRNISDAGFGVTVAPDGRAALQTLDENDFDAVVVDIKLPILSGYDVIARVASKQNPPPVIVLTILSKLEEQVDVSAVLHKPHGFDEVVPALRAVT
jgi:two-component system sensor histidine kinase/response regulator